MKKLTGVVKKWMKEEDGFQVFEKFGLTQSGVLLALGVGAVSILVMNDFWSSVGGRYFASDRGIDALDPINAGAVAPGWGSSTENPWN